MKRFLLFFGVNILIIVMLSLVLNLLGISPYLTAYGIDYQSLAVFCLIWGMGGAFISLMLSKWMAKTMMGVQIVSTTGPNSDLVHMVHHLSKKAGLNTMPEVGIYQSPELNAFATGPSKNNSLVAVSTGLLQRMDREELEGVLGHEVSHIANGDMVTMTLIQGVMNAFVMFLARALAFAIAQASRRDDDREGGMGFFAQYALIMLFETVFGILASLVIAWFSRLREFRADSGSASIAGKEKMIKALEALKRSYPQLQKGETAFRAMQISSKGSWMEAFSTHPNLDRRIDALKKMNIIR